jgi:hypothetical protein
MVKGLSEFNGSDNIFSSAAMPRTLLTAFLTSGYYLFAKRYNLFPCRVHFRYSAAAALFVSFYLSKGVVYHFIAAEKNLENSVEQRARNFENYRSETRHRLLSL